MLAAALGIAIHDPDKTKLARELDDPLSWTTPIRSVLGDDFTLDDRYVSENMTTEDALSHRTGYQGQDMIYGPYIGSQLREVTKRLRYLGPPDKPFRTAMQYNNFMFTVVGDVLETITGRSCGEALKDFLWKPIGMHRTFWHLQDVVDAPHIDNDKHLSRGYYWVRPSTRQNDATEEGFYVPANYANFAGIAPAGAVISSVLEYAKWIQALLDASAPNREDSSPSKPISSALFKDLTAPRISQGLPLPQQSHMGTTSWGLGWHTFPSLLGPRHPMIFHGGGLMGFGSMLTILPNDSFGVVTMGNTQLTANLVGGILSQELMARKLGVKSAGREQELRDFNILMEAQLVGMRHVVDGHPDDDDNEDTYGDNAAMLKGSTPSVGTNLSLDEFVQKDKQDIYTLQNLEGTYEHAAYGSFHVSLAQSPPDSSRGIEKFKLPNATADPYLTYRFPRDITSSATKDKVRAACHSLKIQPIGQRVWNNIYLLHPRVVDEPTTTTTSNANAQDTSPTWFDQEALNIHGSIDLDVVPGLPSGVDGEDGDGTGKCRREICYESMTWTRLGAAFVTSTGEQGRGKVKMGLSLGNSSAYSDGTREKGWEKRMVWFEKKE